LFKVTAEERVIRMKKIFALMLALITVFAIFTACHKQDDTKYTDNTGTDSGSETQSSDQTSAPATPGDIESGSGSNGSSGESIRTTTSDVVQNLPTSADTIKP